MEAEVKLEADPRTFLLEGLEALERVAPLRSDLGECQVRAAQLGSKRVDTDEDLGDLVVRQTPLEHIHPVYVFADAA